MVQKTAVYQNPQAASARLVSAEPSPTGHSCLECTSCCREITMRRYHNIVPRRAQDHLETYAHSEWPRCRNRRRLRISTRRMSLSWAVFFSLLQMVRSTLVETSDSLQMLDISKWRLRQAVCSFSRMLLLCVPAHFQSSAQSKMTCYCGIRDETRERSRLRAKDRARKRGSLWRTRQVRK